MKTYLVGGAVRNQLLGEPVHERDWVVVGATPQEMLELGFQAVGRDFPVFLHPKSHEEYALARTERKTGAGHTGFDCISDKTITLEQDLERRDLTINAIAQDDNGELIDPYGGLADIKSRQLRHVSEAFAEDPLRVLRVARFAATFAHLDFTIADETKALMQSMAAGGELADLTPERVWKETEKALKTRTPQRYFEELRNCKALAILFPEIDRLFGVPQTEKHHPEIDTGIHTLMVLEQAARLSDSTAVRFAALTHDLGKGLTPENEWPRHIAHEARGVKPLKQLCKRLRISNELRDLAVQVCQHHLTCHRAFELRPATIQKLFGQLDLYRKPGRLEPFLLACEADARGRAGFEDKPYPQKEYLAAMWQAARNVTTQSLALDIDNMDGKTIGTTLHNARIKAIETAGQQWERP